jgi:hypothetical protein
VAENFPFGTLNDIFHKKVSDRLVASSNQTSCKMLLFYWISAKMHSHSSHEDNPYDPVLDQPTWYISSNQDRGQHET